jgi:glutathione S-transferase
MVLIVHHLEKSRSHRIVWLLEELGVEYEIKKYNRTAEHLAPKELEAVHPLGKSPVITDNGRVIAETGAIVEYLVNKYGPQLKPAASDEDASLAYTYWLHFAEGSAMPPIVISLLFSFIKKGAPFFIRPIANAITGQVMKRLIDPTLAKQTEFMETTLAKNPKNWFVGEFTAADVIMSFPVETLKDRTAGFDKYPHLAKYLEQVHERPAYKRAEEKGGKLELVG